MIFERAKHLRSQGTHAEQVLWGFLKEHPCGMKFRRQHPIGNYVVDFYCHKLKVVFEVDGIIHDQVEIKKNDQLRQMNLESCGIKVFRFKNDEILREFDLVIKKN